MTTTVNVHEAKTHFSQLLHRVLQGEEITIAKSGKPIAKLTPLKSVSKRIPGNDAGQVIIKSDFDDPLPEFEDL